MALVPDVVKALTAKEIEVAVEAGAGEGASHPDSEYSDAGAKVGEDPWGADVVLKVTPPTAEEVGRLKQGQILIGFLEPLTNPELAKSLAQGGVTSLAMEAIPRITRAQSMDALSSQANLGGYMSVLIAARESGKLFPMMTTAAGTIPPAKVLVLGAGVAGLQAIATAKRLGGVVTGFDVRSVVKEQVQSLGGRFLEVEAVKDAEGEGGYARPLTEEENEKLRQRARRGRQAPGRDHHHGTDPGAPGAAPDHRRGRQEHGAGVGADRPCGRDRRQRRGLQAG